MCKLSPSVQPRLGHTIYDDRMPSPGHEREIIDLLRTHGASNETVRDFNRRIVLNLIRTNNLISEPT